MRDWWLLLMYDFDCWLTRLADKTIAREERGYQLHLKRERKKYLKNRWEQIGKELDHEVKHGIED